MNEVRKGVLRLSAVVMVVLAGSVFLHGCSNNPATNKVSGTVTKVHDGDSIHITPRGSKRMIIRLAGIDAPELQQSFGIESRDQLRSMVLQRKVEANCYKLDRYQRHICVVYRNEADVNLQLVEKGLAWHYKNYEDEQTRKQQRAYAEAETRARRKGSGLWQGNSVAPWEFRRQN